MSRERVAKEYLPHGVTVNELLEKQKPTELEEIQSDIVYRMIRRKHLMIQEPLESGLCLWTGQNWMKEEPKRMITT